MSYILPHTTYAIVVLLELIAFILVLVAVSSPCFWGFELYVYATLFLSFILAVFVPGLLIVILMFCYDVLGLDEWGYAFNWFACIVDVLLGIQLIVVAIYPCGATSQIFMIIGGVLVLLAGIGHVIINFTMVG